MPLIGAKFGYHNESDWLAHKAHREFRGHDSVLETDANGAQIKHWFYQGEASDTCTPNVTGGGLINDPSGCSGCATASS